MPEARIFFEQILAANHSDRTVCLPAGRVPFAEPVRLGPEYSGFTFRGNGTFFDGGKPIRGWNRSGDLWTAPLPAGHRFLYRNGKMLFNARRPGGDAPASEVVRWNSEKDPVSGEWKKNRLECRPPEELLQNQEGAELILYYAWKCVRQKHFHADKEGIDLFFPPDFNPDSECRYAVENLSEKYLLSGQWHPVPEKRLLYYRPLPGEKEGEAEFFSSGAKKLLILDGAENVAFENVVFRHTGDDTAYRVSQADRNGSAALELWNCRNCSFRNCRFEALSGWGLRLAEGTQGTMVENCEFISLGSGAIHISGEPGSAYCGRNVVRACRISHGGRRQADCAALLIRHSGENRIEDNDIHDFPYTGISCGWTWGYRFSAAFGNRIVNNDVHDLGKDQLVLDMGGIYLLGDQPGTVVSGNHVWNICGRHFCWGIYLDEGSAHMTISGNLVHDTENEPFHVNYGRHNLVTGNVFAGGKKSAVCGITRGTMDKEKQFHPGEKLFDFSGNLCIADGMPFYMKYILELPVKQDLTDVWSGNDNYCIQLDPACTVNFVDDYHFINKTWRQIPDEHFLSPDRDNRSVFRYGTLPRTEDLPEPLRGMYSRFLNFNHQSRK